MNPTTRLTLPTTSATRLRADQRLTTATMASRVWQRSSKGLPCCLPPAKQHTPKTQAFFAPCLCHFSTLLSNTILTVKFLHAKGCELRCFQCSPRRALHTLACSAAVKSSCYPPRHLLNREDFTTTRNATLSDLMLLVNGGGFFCIR